jgi:hypothetical protein
MTYPQQHHQQPYPQQPQGWPPPQGYGQPYQYAQPRQAAKPRRVFIWVFLVIQVLFLIWVIAGAASGHSAAVNCHDQYLTHAQCASASETGTAIGVGLLIVFWMVIDVILGVGYGIYRLARRP